MKKHLPADLHHDHTFGQQHRKPGERRTQIVIVLTAVTMVVEIAVGILTGSMALLADGLHMCSHTVALGLATFAYVYARRHAHDDRFAFGTGKVNALAGFAGAILLLGFAILMAFESTRRFIEPVPIVFDTAIAVAVIGLLVNGLSVVILGHQHDSREERTHQHGHAHDDHNLRSAYLHVLADALTSLLAIVALLSGKYLGVVWLDPAMGVVGALLVANWSRGLLRQTSHVLLDRQGPERIRNAIFVAMENDPDVKVADLHLWSIGPGIWAAEVSLITSAPQPVAHYKSLIPPEMGLQHVTLEVNQRT
jgi:cation diffusion facilitator family transporter